MNHVGIDVHKGASQICIITEGGLAAWFVAPGEDRQQEQIEEVRIELAAIRRMLERHVPVSVQRAETLE